MKTRRLQSGQVGERMVKRSCRYKQALELIFKSLNVEPQREFQFHPLRRWKIDFAFPRHMIAVEYEGMAYRGGKSRHTTISGFTHDAEKYNELALSGYILLRFNAEMVQNGMALRQITTVFEKRVSIPGEGEL